MLCDDLSWGDRVEVGLRDTMNRTTGERQTPHPSKLYKQRHRTEESIIWTLRSNAQTQVDSLNLGPLCSIRIVYDRDYGSMA